MANFPRKWIAYETFSNSFTSVCDFFSKGNCYYSLSKNSHIPTCSLVPMSKFLTANKTRLLIQLHPCTLSYSTISTLTIVLYKYILSLSRHHLFPLLNIHQSNPLGYNTITFQPTLLPTQVQQTFPGTPHHKILRKSLRNKVIK